MPTASASVVIGDVIAAIDKYSAGDTITLKLYRYNYDARFLAYYIRNQTENS